MDDPHARAMKATVDVALDGPGHLEPATRRQIADAPEAPAHLRAFVDQVRQSAWKITDEDVAAVVAGGLSEDQVFEVTVSAALGVARRQLAAAHRAMDAAASAKAGAKAKTTAGGE